MKQNTPVHDAVIEIIKSSALASEREEKLKALLNITIAEGAENITQADRVAEAILTRLGIDRTPQTETNVDTLYPSMKSTETPHDEPLDGFDEGLKDFAKSFYTSCKEGA